MFYFSYILNQFWFEAIKGLRLCGTSADIWSVAGYTVGSMCVVMLRGFIREGHVAVATRHPSDCHTRLPIKENNNDCDSHFHCVMKTEKRFCALTFFPIFVSFFTFLSSYRKPWVVTDVFFATLLRTHMVILASKAKHKQGFQYEHSQRV